MEGVIGKVIDSYRIIEVLGKGGMGVVYKAQDTTLDREVALKMMDSRLASDDSFLKRFQSEAKALAKIHNPNIVGVYALRETELGLCIIMEYVDGRTLADAIEDQGALPFPRILNIFRQLLTAFTYAHKAGIVHRDIKPSNVMLTADDTVKVTDFGLAKIQQNANVTATMGTGGTLYYMPPEQIRGLSLVDSRGDIYSLGMTLYEAAAGRVPFTDMTSDFDIRQSIVSGKIVSPDKINPAMPKSLVKVIMRSIEKDPEKRFQTAEEFWQALEKVEAPTVVNQGTVFTSKNVSMPPAPSAKSPKLLIYGVAVVVLLGLAYGVYSFVSDTSATMLSVATSPAEVMIYKDGEAVGVSPLSAAEVTPGQSVNLRFEKEGYAALDTSVAVAEGQTLALSISLRKEQKEIADQPLKTDTTAFVQNTQTETRTQPVRDERRERPTNTTPTNQTTTQPDKPAATTATLTVNAPADGSVSVNGKSAASNGNAGTVQTPSGKASVEFRSAKHGSKTFDIDLKPGEKKSLACYFEMSISVNANPTWGVIVVDGSPTEYYTPKVIRLGPGRHTITVQKNGYKTSEGAQAVTVTPSLVEKSTKLSFTLEPL